MLNAVERFEPSSFPVQIVSALACQVKASIHKSSFEDISRSDDGDSRVDGGVSTMGMLPNIDEWWRPWWSIERQVGDLMVMTCNT